MITHASAPDQLPLIHIIESDDVYLQHQPEVVWFDVPSKLDYQQFQTTAARYYETLWRFNQQQAKQRQQRLQNAAPPNPESQHQATQRLLFNRLTLNKDAEVLYQSPSPEVAQAPIDGGEKLKHDTNADSEFHRNFDTHFGGIRASIFRRPQAGNCGRPHRCDRPHRSQASSVGVLR